LITVKSPSVAKQQEQKQTPPPKAPMVMKKKEEQKPKQQQVEEISKDLSYKEIIETKTSENYQFLLNNAAILKLIREYSNFYSDNLEKKYNKILKEIIHEKVFSIESEIKSMKEISEKIKNTKINLGDLKFDNSNMNKNNNIKGNEKSEYKNIFDLSRNSIIEIKEKIKALPQNKTESLRFNVEFSDFYLNVDIDKSYEIFKEFILAKSVPNDWKASVEEYAGNFLMRTYELDRFIYVTKLILKFFIYTSIIFHFSYFQLQYYLLILIF
jgi:hypothetical protein